MAKFISGVIIGILLTIGYQQLNTVKKEVITKKDTITLQDICDTIKIIDTLKHDSVK